jgi:hypothetical protein
MLCFYFFSVELGLWLSRRRVFVSEVFVGATEPPK